MSLTPPAWVVDIKFLETRKQIKSTLKGPGGCVRGARVQRGDQRTEPRRLSGVSSRPVKVGAAGTRLALERRDWTRLLAKERLCLRPSRQRLLRRLARVRTFSSRLFLPRLPWTLQSLAEKFFLLGFSERVCVCSCALLSLLGFWHQASSIQLKPALTG